MDIGHWLGATLGLALGVVIWFVALLVKHMVSGA